MIIIAIIVTIVLALLGGWFIGLLGVSLNLPNLGAVFSAVAMSVYILYAITKKKS